jgi:BirA family biotin operon repressor/biotin-[acetyl-CoA-carboxylase] ligase
VNERVYTEDTIPNQLDITSLQKQLHTHLIGIADRLIYLPSVASTNTLAMHLAQKDAEPGVVVLTDSQTAGKGRQGRSWVDTAGCNAIVSLILRPLFPAYLLIMITSVAVVNAIKEVCEVVATIKWPNDVLIEGRKVAGILIETSRTKDGHMVAVVGIGVNINVPPINKDSAEAALLSTIATTLEVTCGHKVSRETFIATLLRQIETSYSALQEEAQVAPNASQLMKTPASLLARERWRNHLSTLGQAVQVRQGETMLHGLAEDVNENGELLLRLHSGERVSITWGDVWHTHGYADNAQSLRND